MAHSYARIVVARECLARSCGVSLGGKEQLARSRWSHAETERGDNLDAIWNKIKRLGVSSAHCAGP